MAIFDGDSSLLAAITPTSVANLECMAASRAYFPKVHTNGDKMAALAATGHDLLGFDSVAPYYCIHQEAAALGCKMNWGTRTTMPSIVSGPVLDLDKLRRAEAFLDAPSTRAVLEAVGLLKQRYEGKVAVIGKVIGPWTLAYNLCGIQSFLLNTVLDTEYVKELLDVLKEITLKFAFAQIEAGADILTWADHATANLVSYKMYEELLYPVHKECTKRLEAASPRKVPLILHTCGDTMDRVWLFAKAGFDAFHFDSTNSPIVMMAEVEERMLLTGCVNNPNTLLNGSKIDVYEQVNSIIDAGVRLISPECAIPPVVRSENLRAIVSAVRRRMV